MKKLLAIKANYCIINFKVWMQKEDNGEFKLTCKTILIY